MGGVPGLGRVLQLQFCIKAYHGEWLQRSCRYCCIRNNGRLKKCFQGAIGVSKDLTYFADVTQLLLLLRNSSNELEVSSQLPVHHSVENDWQVDGRHKGSSDESWG